MNSDEKEMMLKLIAEVKRIADALDDITNMEISHYEFDDIDYPESPNQ